MNPKCFFCNADLKMKPDTSGGQFRVKHSESCQVCATAGNLHEVVSTYNDNGGFSYVHIQTDKQEFITLEGPHLIGKRIVPALRVRSNTSYHIRYNVDKNTTDIMKWGDIEPIVSVPGQKIKPSNAREKLKLYLLFS